MKIITETRIFEGTIIVMEILEVLAIIIIVPPTGRDHMEIIMDVISQAEVLAKIEIILSTLKTGVRVEKEGNKMRDNGPQPLK